MMAGIPAPFNSLEQYVDCIRGWCKLRGEWTFKHSDLPGLLQTYRGGLLQRAHNNGMVRRVTSHQRTRVTVWELRKV